MEICGINSIKNVSQNFGNQQAQNQQFDAKSRQTDSNKVWKYLGAAAAVAAACIGIGYAIKNGKIKNLNLGDFKKLGKFDKGKALLNNGKTYTGTINVANSKGKFALEYVDGVLKSSTKTNAKSGVVEMVKSYIKGGVLVKKFDNAGKVISSKFSSKELAKANIEAMRKAQVAAKLYAENAAKNWELNKINLQNIAEYDGKIRLDLVNVGT